MRRGRFRVGEAGEERGALLAEGAGGLEELVEVVVRVRGAV
ncbi:hypothetical protein [Streptomyces sp. NE06-03C]|nr:hypothetical protein [Streptomyces sp. NE06-03C]MDX2922160.1 hypothetical protein [Streptomyces sp. NE06-03C]